MDPFSAFQCKLYRFILKLTTNDFKQKRKTFLFSKAFC